MTAVTFTQPAMPYRLALDLGASSLGWAICRLSNPANGEKLKPVALVKAGVRIFPKRIAHLALATPSP